MTETTDTADVQRRREDLLRRSREAHAQLEALLATIPEEEQTRPGVTGDWSVKDHLAHLTWWEQLSVCQPQWRNGQPVGHSSSCGRD